MSSFHPNEPLNKAGFTEDVLPCPECGKLALRRITADCALDDGTVVPELAHWRCSNCGEELFDLEAMRQIREFQASVKRRPRSKLKHTSVRVREAAES
ncbi:MAG: YgiT-type zinc finger protein [Calditrichota bacterium]